MARPNSVWWWAARQRWAFTVGRKRHVAPKWIGEGDKDRAERWCRKILEVQYPDRPIVGVLPDGGRVTRQFRVKVLTVRRLRRLVGLCRKATGKRTTPGRVIDGLVRDAIRGANAAKNPENSGSHP